MLVHKPTGLIAFAQRDSDAPDFVKVTSNDQVVRWQRDGCYGVVNKFEFRRAVLTFTTEDA